MKKEPIIFFTLYLFISLLFNATVHSTFSQITKNDSLLFLLRKDKEDTNKIIHLNTLAWELKYSNPDTSIILGKKALAISKKIGWNDGMSNLYGNLGTYYRLKADYNNALYNYRKALKINVSIMKGAKNYIEKQKAKNGIARTLGGIGNVFNFQGDYPKALTCYFKALKVSEETGDKDMVAGQTGNIGNVYNAQSDDPQASPSEKKQSRLQALQYYYRAMKLGEELGDKKRIAIQLGNIGIVYWKLRDYSKALKYYFDALKIDEELKNKAGVARHIGNIGIVFLELGEKQKNNIKKDSLFNKALEYYFKALKVAEEQGNKNGMSIVLGDIGTFYMKIGKFPEAEKYLINALVISDSIGIINETQTFEFSLSHLYDTLALLKENNPALNGFGTLSEIYKKALTHYKKYCMARDSIFNEEKSKEIGRLEQKHEYEMAELKHQQEEKEKSRKLAVKLNRRNNLQYSAILLGIFALFVIVFFVVRFKLPHWTTELVVFIPFLILFEFVLVLLDPYIEQITKGEPLWKLLANASLAAVIFPLHQFFEKMLKKRIS
ncbi:MAG: hypothetical protein A3H98_06570 [Bacteroidetes bacterium RIFCSPLOWO2_02_FULL_36_8]|nr:MAG: hypothetical protein A3H98_06570 [Bacteroidetes bacterium RIFCSPLOWO2_02_FULL_36_8]OFY71127.1 MAG: hypothetical protein A3G23_15080 [Bacteroidetes bacterium RIFCSPLOWO2_12_FULL_37_12]